MDGHYSRYARNRRLWIAVGSLLLVALIGLGSRWSDTARGDDSIAVSTSSDEASDHSIPTKNLWQILLDGGPLMIPIGVCSLVLAAVTIERITSLRRDRVVPLAFVARFLRQVRREELDSAAALSLCEKNGSPVAEVFAGAIRKWGRPSVEVEQGIIDAGERVVNHLRKNLRVISGIATVTPLLGLLGTVLGMINAFNAVATADATGRPELLAAGISQALLTTAAGLCVAIPAYVCHTALVGQVDKLIVEIDKQGQELVHIISSDPMSETSRRHGAHTLAGPKSASRKTASQAS